MGSVEQAVGVALLLVGCVGAGVMLALCCAAVWAWCVGGIHARREARREAQRGAEMMMAELRRVWCSPGHPGHGCSGVWVSALHGLDLPLVSGDATARDTFR